MIYNRFINHNRVATLSTLELAIPALFQPVGLGSQFFNINSHIWCMPVCN